MRSIIKFYEANKKIIFQIIAVILISIFCFSIAPKTFQNDTFYSVSIGKLIMENGIDMKDHFSWHENLPYTYPHWLFDVLTYLIYNIGNWEAIYIGVCILSIILGLTVFFVNQKLAKSKVISLLITIGVMYLLKDYIPKDILLQVILIIILI